MRIGIWIYSYDIEVPGKSGYRRGERRGHDGKIIAKTQEGPAARRDRLGPTADAANLNGETWVLTWNPQDTKTKEPHVLPLDGRPLEII